MLKIWCISVLFALNLQSFAQGSFNYHYPFDSGVSSFRTLLIERDTILLQGYFLDTVAPFVQGIAFAKIDSNGHLISYERYFDPKGRDLVPPPLNDMVKLSDGRYLTVSISLQDGALQLIFLSHDFKVDTFFEYFANDPTVQVNWIRSAFELEDGYLVFGSAQRLTFLNDGQIFRLKKNGELVWRKWYGIYNKDEFIGDVCRYTDSTFIVGSFHKPFPVQGEDKRRNTWIFEVDVNGNILDEFVDPDLFSGTSGGLVVDTNRNIYFAGESIVVGQYGEHNALGRIGMLNSNFELQWKQEYGKNLAIYTGLTDMIISDKSLIAIGSYFDTITIENKVRRPRLGFSTMTSMLGDSLCQRYDTAQWYTTISSSCNFRSMDTLSSGRIVVCGEGRFGPANNYSEYAWLVKMPNPPCEATQVSTDDINPLKPNWVASPNPSSTTIFINFDKEPFLDELHFKLFDAEGRIIKRFKVDGNSGQFELSLEDINSGTYFLQSVDENGRLTGVQKLVVIK